MSIDMKSMIGLKERIPRRWISTRGALLILLGLIANLGLWWSLQLYRTPARVNKVDEVIFGNSTESYYYKQLDYRLGNMIFEDGTNNVTGFEEMIVPDIVHFLLMDTKLDFVTLVSMLSVLRHHRPRFLLLHTNMPDLGGRYLDKLLAYNQTDSFTTIEVKQIKRPEYVHGLRLAQVWHTSDVVRIKILRLYGGIFLDNDVYVAQPLHRYRYFEMSLGWPPGQYLGTQVLVAHRNARFLKLWYGSYYDYDGSQWYYNAGQLPTIRFLRPNRSLVHRVPIRFGVDDLVVMLYCSLNRNWQQEFDTIHLLIRHRHNFGANKLPDYFETFDEHNIRQYNRTYGEMARLAYYNTINLIKD